MLERNCGRSSFFSNNHRAQFICQTSVALLWLQSSNHVRDIAGCESTRFSVRQKWLPCFSSCSYAEALVSQDANRSQRRSPEISLARSVQFLLNFKLERCDIIGGVLQTSIVSKSGFKQITKTRWILQHFDGISLAKQNADRGTSFLTSMCFQRKNDWNNLRKFQSNLRFGSQAKPGVVKRKLRVLPNERWQIKGLSMPFVLGEELVLLSKCDYTTDTVQFFWVCSAWDNVKGMLQSVEVGARLSKLSLD